MDNMRDWYENGASVLDYLPECLAGCEIFAELAAGADRGINDLKEYAVSVLDNCYVLTADAETVARYERLWNLSADGLPLENRRARIAAKLRQHPPINGVMLKKMMCGILGNIVKVEKGNGDYTLVVKYREETGTEDVDFAKVMIRELIPANMMLEVVYAYNEWQDVEALTWGRCKDFSWQELLESDIAVADMEV